MKLHHLHRTQFLPISVEDAWQFFSSPHNLPAITPPWLNLKISEGVFDSMFPGMLIRYRLTPMFGWPITWVSEITHAKPPTYFVDEQRFGPYRFWHHQHHFRTVNEGVEMTDIVSYQLKFGPIGTLLHASLVKKRLKDIFDFRQQTLVHIFKRRVQLVKQAV